MDSRFLTRDNNVLSHSVPRMICLRQHSIASLYRLINQVEIMSRHLSRHDCYRGLQGISTCHYGAY